MLVMRCETCAIHMLNGWGAMYQGYPHHLRMDCLTGAAVTHYPLPPLKQKIYLCPEHHTVLQAWLRPCPCPSPTCLIVHVFPKPVSYVKHHNRVKMEGHTKDSSEAVAETWQECFKLIVSTSESDPYMSSSSNDLVSDYGLSKGLDSITGEW